MEIALWDLAGKAWGVPVWQLLGGKYRDKIRVYCDTDADGKDNTGHAMGLALKKRLEMGFTFLKMDLGIGILMDKPGTLCAPLGFLDDMKQYAPHILNVQGGSVTADMVAKQESYSIVTTAHPFTGIHITEKGLDVLEQYVREVREVIGYEVPLAIDHFGHVCVEDCIRFARRMEPYNIAWMEDMVPWIYPDQLARLRSATTIPVCTGEDIYLKEGFAELFKKQAVSVIHPDILTCGGALELKKIADMADENGVAVAIHMAESPIAALAAVHTAAAMHNVLAMELHSVDIPWWQDLVNGPQKPFVKDGFITVPDAPGPRHDLHEVVLAQLAGKTHLFGTLPERGREALVQTFGSPDYRALSPEMRKTFVKVISLDLTDRLEQIKAPTLLYWGAQDTETPLWMAQVMQERIPDAGLVVEEGAGHFAYLEHSAKFLRIVRSFLLEGRE